MSIFIPNYDLPLTDWISLGITKSSLENVMNRIESNESIDDLDIKRQNKKHISKILREKITRQFGGSNGEERPLLDLVINSLDANENYATNESSDYAISIYVDNKQCEIVDSGISMSLDNLLNEFIIPFSTEKEGIHERGLHGMGFLSTLKYLLQRPLQSEITVHTNDGNSNYKVTFYSSSRDVEDIRMSISKSTTKRSQGTAINIKHKFDIEEIETYLKKSLYEVPSNEASIFLNQTQINTLNISPYIVPVTQTIDGVDHKQNMFISFNNTGVIRLSGQHIPIKDKSTSRRGITISFPSGVKPTEGRDEFAINSNYERCVNASFKIIEDELRAGNFSRKDAAEFITNLTSAYETINRLSDIPNLREMNKLIFEDVHYLFKNNNAGLHNFMPSEGMQDVLTLSAPSYAYWQKHHGHVDEIDRFINEKFSSEKIPSSESENYHKKIRELPNLKPTLNLLKKGAALLDCSLIKLGGSGKKPFFRHNFELFINVDHPLVQGEFDLGKAYNLINELSFSDFSIDDSIIEKHQVDEIAAAYATDQMYKPIKPEVSSNA